MTLLAARFFRAAPRWRRPARLPGRPCSSLPRPGRRARHGRPEAGAKLTVMRWKRFVPAEDEAFNAMVAAFKTATGTEMNVFSESFEDVQPKASVAANTGSGLDLAWGLHTLPQLFPTKVLKMNDVADYLGKKYGGWTDAAAKTCKQGNDWLGIPVATDRRLHDLPQVGRGQGRLQGIPEGLPRLPRAVQGAEEEQHAGRLRARPCLGRRQCAGCTGCCGATAPTRSTRTTRSSSTRRRR